MQEYQKTEQKQSLFVKKRINKSPQNRVQRSEPHVAPLLKTELPTERGVELEHFRPTDRGPPCCSEDGGHTFVFIRLLFPGYIGNVSIYKYITPLLIHPSLPLNPPQSTQPSPTSPSPNLSTYQERMKQYQYKRKNKSLFNRDFIDGTVLSG